MNKSEFSRVTPESVGINSETIESFLDVLESGITEPHGVMIMRYGKVCAEGWWAPYEADIVHGLQSHTKTYAATAIGIAITEGLLTLDDKLIDIFKEESPKNSSENLRKLAVHHVLSMSNGMEKMPEPTKYWIEEFLATEVEHVPGTKFMYNSVGSTVLGAIIKKLTGIGLHDYLKPRLFDKIGINSSELKWMHMPDGLEFGGGGLFATTEDNLRLMKLYADGGIWNDERILSEEYIKRATSKQVDTAEEELVNPPAKDNFLGYGYQIWMCKPNGAYRADGAMGQFTIVVPDKELIIAITENAAGAHWAQKTLDAIWDFVSNITAENSLPINSEAAVKLSKRLTSLSLPLPAISQTTHCDDFINKAKYSVKSGYLVLEDQVASVMCGSSETDEISSFSFDFNEEICTMYFTQGGIEKHFEIGLNGTLQKNIIHLTNSPITIALASGEWATTNIFILSLRWVETCYENKFYFTFKGDTVEVERKKNFIFGNNVTKEIKILAKR